MMRSMSYRWCLRIAIPVVMRSKAKDRAETNPASTAGSSARGQTGTAPLAATLTYLLRLRLAL